MKIATWNVQLVKQRLEHLLIWLKETAPDIVCLQEIKCRRDRGVPALRDRGARLQRGGARPEGLQRGGHPVAAEPFDEVVPGACLALQSANSQRSVHGGGGLGRTSGAAVRVASIYLPNGNPPVESGEVHHTSSPGWTGS
jgi:exodeoxyribonuclease-3